EDLAVECERSRRRAAGALEADRRVLAVRVDAQRAAVLHVDDVRALMDLDLAVHLAARVADPVLLEVHDERLVRVRADRAVPDVASLGGEIVPVPEHGRPGEAGARES